MAARGRTRDRPGVTPCRKEGPATARLGRAIPSLSLDDQPLQVAVKPPRGVWLELGRERPRRRELPAPARNATAGAAGCRHVVPVAARLGALPVGHLDVPVGEQGRGGLPMDRVKVACRMPYRSFDIIQGLYCR